jgi:hypothetical protein
MKRLTFPSILEHSHVEIAHQTSLESANIELALIVSLYAMRSPRFIDRFMQAIV